MKKAYHDEGSDDPVYEHTKEDLGPDFSLLKDQVEGFEFDFTEDGIHHNEKTDC